MPSMKCGALLPLGLGMLQIGFGTGAGAHASRTMVSYSKLIMNKVQLTFIFPPIIDVWFSYEPEFSKTKELPGHKNCYKSSTISER
jgi:hypothetical protein